MSSFLVNLARRGAGLPTTAVQAPPPSPFGLELGRHVDAATETHGAARDLAMVEQPATGDTVTQAPLRASSSEGRAEPSLAVPTQHTPAIQRFSEIEPRTPSQPSVAEPVATLRSPSLEPSPAPQWSELPHARPAPAAPIEPPKRLDPAVPPYPTERGDVTESDVEHDLHPPLSVVHSIAAAAQPARHASSLPSASAMVLQEPGQQQGVALPELAPERPRTAAQPRRETALPAATIRPALAESHIVLDFPSVPSQPSLTPSAPLPIHVRIGRVEVRSTTASEPAPARPRSPAPVGFDAYYRMRNYRS
jgi:hypothetical protein